jgi:uncharacterized repeat protein (TIGR03803 family)
VFKGVGYGDAASPAADLALNKGVLYGTSLKGGKSGNDGTGDGTVWKLDLATGQEAVVTNQFGGKSGHPQTGAVWDKGYIYGGDYNAIFRVSPSGVFTKLLAPPGQMGGNFVRNGKLLYGVTGGPDNGSFYSFDPATDQVSTIYMFAGGTDGSTPLSPPVISGGMVYGTTVFGGDGYGTIYSIDLQTGIETVLYRFSGKMDGAAPLGDLVLLNGVLFGTSDAGGYNSENCGAGYGGDGCGTIWKLDLQSGSFATVFNFRGNDNGGNPSGGLTLNKGLLMGTTIYGNGNGIVGYLFSVDPTTGALTTLYGFSGSADGGNPIGGLLSDKGVIYGTTSNANVQGYVWSGTVFKYQP